MKNYRSNHTLFCMLTAAILILLSGPACNLLTPGKGKTPENTAAPISQTPTFTATAPVPTEAASPTPITAEDLTVIKSGVAQNTDIATAVFIVKNPNKNISIQSTLYEVTFYDAAGTALCNQTGFLNNVYPQETTALTLSSYLCESQTVVKAEIKFGESTLKVSDQVGPVAKIEQANLFALDSPFVTGILSNNLEVPLTELILTAVVYDADGKIIGGGQVNTNFAPVNQPTGVLVPVVVDGKPAKSEIYPTYAKVEKDQGGSANANALVISDKTYADASKQLYSTLFVQNTDATRALENSLYRITYYETDSQVYSVAEGTLGLILAGQTNPVITQMGCIDQTCSKDPQKVDIQLLPGKFVDLSLPEKPLTVEQENFFQMDDFSGTNMAGSFNSVTGLIRNNLNVDVSNIEVSAVCYGPDGKSIGGGKGTIPFILAGQISAVQMSVYGMTKKTPCDLFPTFTSSASISDKAAGADQLQVIDQGFRQIDQSVGMAFLAKNNSGVVMQGAQYRLIAYDQQGQVLDTDGGVFYVLSPNETGAGYSNLSIPRGKTVAKVDLQVQPGEPLKTDLTQSPFEYGKVRLVPLHYSGSLFGQVVNTSDRKVDAISVVAVLYDKSDHIVGGGTGYILSIPAGEQTETEVMVDSLKGVARGEVYAGLTDLSFELAK